MIVLCVYTHGVPRFIVQVQCCFKSTETIRTIRDGEHRMAISIFAHLLSSEVYSLIQSAFAESAHNLFQEKFRGGRKAQHLLVTHTHKLQALVYDILPSTIAVFSYAIGSRKLSVNEQFLLGLKQ